MLFRKVLLVGLVLALATVAWSADTNKVTGSYMVDGKTTQLKFAYPINETCKGKKCLSVLFSAAAISPTDQKTTDAFMTFSDQARKGAVQAVQVIFNMDKTISGVRIYDKAFDGALQTGGNEKFESTKFDATGIDGKITMDSPHSFFEQKFQYNMTFSVSFAAK